MSQIEKRKPKTRRTIAVAAGFVACLSVVFLSYNVMREIRLLGSASSDNVQWALSQTEVEFLDFRNQIETDDGDVGEVRQKFDVFYSRITTINRAQVFEQLRENTAPRGYLETVNGFLDTAVVLIDAEDPVLLASLPELSRLTADARPVVRALTISGLRLFAQAADTQRQAVARTLIQLAEALAVLIGALALSILYFYRLNKKISAREHERNQAAARMKTVMGTSLDGVIVSDAEGRVLEFSPAAEAMFGYRSEDVLGREIGAIIVPDHMRDAHNVGMERMRLGGEKHVVGKGRVKLEAKRANGDIFPVELALQSADTDDGAIFIAFLRDISLRVAAEAELVAARDKALASEKMKTDFLATMSHEIRTPLNGLLGNMSLLRDTSLNRLQDRYVSYMETSGCLLMSHISDVLDITRYDAGKLTTLSEPMNISALLQDIIDNQSSTASRNETTLEWGWDGPAMNWISSDHDRLQHVLMNLIGNAVKFTKRGKVSVTAHQLEQDGTDHLLIKIADTGPGISEELATRIFDDFVTGNTAYDREVGGTGLGLSIAKRFVTSLGGTIGVDSIVGEGSTFWIKLPVASAQAPADAKTQDFDRALSRPLNVLLVEDNEINRTVAREMIEAEGHHVTLANDGRMGVEKAKSDRFDLIFMDISMPVMDGRVATRTIRKDGGASAQTPIIALTANAVAAEQENFKADGMNGILTKPLSRSALRNTLLTHQPQSPASAVSPVSQGHSAEARAALGEVAFAKLRGRFVNEVEDLIGWLQSDDVHDYIEVAARSHKVAGSAAVFGAIQLNETLKSLEGAAKAGDYGTVERIVFGLNGVWQDTKTALLA